MSFSASSLVFIVVVLGLGLQVLQLARQKLDDGPQQVALLGAAFGTPVGGARVKDFVVQVEVESSPEVLNLRKEGVHLEQFFRETTKLLSSCHFASNAGSLWPKTTLCV